MSNVNNIIGTKSIDGSTPSGLSAKEIIESFTPTEQQEIVTTGRKALDELTNQKCFFSPSQLQKKIEKNLENSQRIFSNPRLIDYINEILIPRLDLIQIGKTGQYTTETIAEMEKEMLQYAGRKSGKHKLDINIIKAAIAARLGISDEQEKAVWEATFSLNDVTVIEGTAGAGKSFTMAAIKKAFMDSGYEVRGTALAWNAAGVLAASTKISNCEAINGMVKQMEDAEKNGTDYFKKPTLLIVDEAGMVDLRFMYKLLRATALSKYPVKVVLTGDTLQLNPVNAGSALEAIVRVWGTTRIDTIRRQVQESHRIAVKKFSERQPGLAFAPFIHQEAVHWCKDEEATFYMIVRDFLSYKMAFPNKTPLILAMSNLAVTELNKRVRAAYKKLGLVKGPEVELTVTNTKDKWRASFGVGDEVVMRKNSKDLNIYEIPEDKTNMDENSWTPARVGVFNRNSGRIVGIKKGKQVGSYDLIIDMSGDLVGRVVINTRSYKDQQNGAFPIHHNFATTIYASQGQTVQKVFMLDSSSMNFRLSYVGMSRHTDSVEVYLNETEIHTRLDKANRKVMPKDKSKSNEEQRNERTKDEYDVELGRYSRQEMLNSVLAAWGAAEFNQTAYIYDLENKTQYINQKELFNQEKERNILRINPGSNPVDFDSNRIVASQGDTWETLAQKAGVDLQDVGAFEKWKLSVRNWNGFLPESYSFEEGEIIFLRERLNVKYPIIDMKKLYDLPDQPHETLFVSDDIIDKRNKNDKNPTVAPEKKKTKPSYRGNIYDSSLPEKVVEGNDEEEDFNSFGVSFGEKIPEPESQDVLAYASDEFGEKKEIKVPFLKDVEQKAFLNKKGLLEFKDSHNLLTEEFSVKTKDVLWAEGKFFEPRILSWHKGAVASRFTLDGRCVTGNLALPPLTRNPNADKSTPISIVRGSKEYLLTLAFNESRVVDNPAKKPHVMWAAQESHMHYYQKQLKSMGESDVNNVQIVRGNKPSVEDTEWSIKLQNYLWSEFNVKSVIRPAIPDYINPFDETPSNNLKM